MPTSDNVEVKRQFLEKLHNYGRFSYDQVNEFMHCVIAEDYSRLFSSQGTPCTLDTQCLRPDGTPHLIEDVPLEDILKAAESLIGNSVPTDQQTQALLQVMDGVSAQSCFALRAHDKVLSGSVIIPKLNDRLPGEVAADVGTEIDRDCDQIRAMIKILTCHGGEWTVDQFRRTLGHISRPKLTSFLEKWGPRGGVHCLSFLLGWEFFKLREILGCPLVKTNPPGSPYRDFMQERDPNRGQKRSSIGRDGESVKYSRTLSALTTRAQNSLPKTKQVTTVILNILL
ncbi:hypothetical protein F4804DRAFT_350767 [Jackrogersella minutella]|nr:hypothetical protein F4804DRAFT_350767 [Jackrogersella minutella]